MIWNGRSAACLSMDRLTSSSTIRTADGGLEVAVKFAFELGGGPVGGQGVVIHHLHHPRGGEWIVAYRRFVRRGRLHFVIEQPDGWRVLLPAWITKSSAVALPTVEVPRLWRARCASFARRKSAARNAAARLRTQCGTNRHDRYDRRVEYDAWLSPI